jgi:hypothetical protein
MAKQKKPKRRKDGSAQTRLSPTSAAVLHGEVDLVDWDDEELLRGKRRSADGTFKGRPTQVVPTEVLHELNRRRFTRAHALLASSLEDTIHMLLSIVNDPASADSDRIKAAEILLDRTLGKPTERVQLGLGFNGDDPPWKRAVVNAIVGTAQQAAALEATATDAEIIDVEPTDETLVDPRTGEPEQITWQDLDARTPQCSRS